MQKGYASSICKREHTKDTRMFMERNAVLTQTTETEEKDTTRWYRWMRHFFTEDVSPDNHPLIGLQRRAVWIGLALILQSSNEIPYYWYMPYIQPFGSLVPFFLILGSFVALYMAFRPTTLKQKTQDVRKHPRRWQRFLLILIVLLTIPGGIEIVRGTVMNFLPPQFTNDGTSLDTNAAMLLIQGKNPYSDSNMLTLARMFPIQPNWTTPLEEGQLAGHTEYPSLVELQSILDTDLKAGNAPEFESKVSYPALSFLTLVPFALFHDYNVMPFYALSFLLLVYIAWKVVKPEMRPWAILLAVANVPMIVSTIGANLDIFTILLLVLAWLWRDKRWASAVMLGLALASKQPAWFYLPFYLILTFRLYGFKETIYRSLIAGCVGLAINLPFIIWNSHAFIAGILAPVSDPMYPMGVGLVNLSVMHLIPFLPKTAYTVLELAAMPLTYLWYWRICRTHPESAMLLAVLPLFMAWRSLSSYFYCTAFPLFILQAARGRVHKSADEEEKQRHFRFLQSARNEESTLGLPQSVSVRFTNLFW